MSVKEVDSMLLSLLSRQDKINFLDLLLQLILVDGEPNEIEKQIQKKFRYEMGDDVLKYHHVGAVDTKKIIEYFSTKPKTTQNLVFMNLFAASLDDEWYNVEQHLLLDDVQQTFGITNKKKIELMKVVYADRDLKEKAKRIICE